MEPENRGVEVLPGYRVNEITKKEIKMKKKSGEEKCLGRKITSWKHRLVFLEKMLEFSWNHAKYWNHEMFMDSFWLDTVGQHKAFGHQPCLSLMNRPTLRTLPYGWSLASAQWGHDGRFSVEPKLRAPCCFQACEYKACLASYSWFMMQETHVFFYSVAPCWMLQCPCSQQWGVVWAAGIKQNELTNQLKSALLEMNHGVSEKNVKLGSWGLTWPDVCCNKVVFNDLRVVIVSPKFSQLRALLQTPANGIITDDWLQVRGSGGSIYVAWPEIATTGWETPNWPGSFFVMIIWYVRVLEHTTGGYLKPPKKLEALDLAKWICGDGTCRHMTFSHMVVSFGKSSSFITVGKSRLVHYNYPLMMWGLWHRSHRPSFITRSSLRQKKVWLVNLPQRSILSSGKMVVSTTWFLYYVWPGEHQAYTLIHSSSLLKLSDIQGFGRCSQCPSWTNFALCRAVSWFFEFFFLIPECGDKKTWFSLFQKPVLYHTSTQKNEMNKQLKTLWNFLHLSSKKGFMFQSHTLQRLFVERVFFCSQDK